jgi:Ca-activated chloride channel family protein
MAADYAMAGSMAPASDPTLAPLSPTAFDTEDYNPIDENPFVAVADDPLSTFSIDVDTASYANTRRFLDYGQLPPADAVRIEELINYFEYDYPDPTGADPFSINTEVSTCPWDAQHRLVHVGLQGKHVELDAIPPRNLVFLVDVSGSMQSADKLPLLKEGLRMLADDLRPDDRVSIVVYAGNAGTVLEPTSDKGKIKRSLRRLRAGGSTNGAGGIHQAYAMAEDSFIEGGINRVILASDGDFNVGATSQGELVDLIEEKRQSGVFLSVLGFGTGNLNDAMMEQIADHGNGNYAYIDSRREARRVLVEQANATLVPIAKDVKIQVEFNPTQVEAYRLIGYENRQLADQDFNDDRKDAGEIGAGHSVTALYEVVPAGAGEFAGKVDALEYQSGRTPNAAAASGDLMTVKIRYKQPDGDQSKLIARTIQDGGTALEATSDDFRFSAAVAAFGMSLRESQRRGSASFALAQKLAKTAMKKPRSRSETEARQEFVELIKEAAALAGATSRRAG